jgi:hypothetical protein
MSLVLTRLFARTADRALRASRRIGKGCASTRVAAKELKHLPDSQDGEVLHKKEALLIAQFLSVRCGFGHGSSDTGAVA